LLFPAFLGLRLGDPEACRSQRKTSATLLENSAAGYHVSRGQSSPSLPRALPFVLSLAASPVARGVDRARRAVPEKQPDTENGTRWSGSRLGQRRNPEMLQSRSTHRCCCKPSPGSGICGEEDCCRTLAGDCPRPANRDPSLPAGSENGPFPARQS